MFQGWRLVVCHRIAEGGNGGLSKGVGQCGARILQSDGRVHPYGQIDHATVREGAWKVVRYRERVVLQTEWDWCGWRVRPRHLTRLEPATFFDDNHLFLAHVHSPQDDLCEVFGCRCRSTIGQ